MSKLRTIAACVMSAVACFSAQADVIIDDFNTGSTGTFVAETATPFVGGSQAGTMIGGQRDMMVYHVSGDGSTTAKVAGGTYQFGMLGESEVGKAIIRWDGAGSNYTQGTDFDGLCNPTCANLSGMGSAIVFNVSADQGNTPAATPANVIITIYDGTDPTGNRFATLEFDIEPTGGLFVSFPILFTDPDWNFFGGMTVAGFTTVGAGMVEINANLNGIKLDVDIDQISIPEPAGLALTGLALLAAGAARRRKSAR